MSTIGAVILAAGMSTRMGRFKPVLPLNGQPLFRYAVDAAIAAELSPIALVGGCRSGELTALAAPIGGLDILENPDYASGMASSLRLGIRALTGRTRAAFVFLADQPLVSPRAIAAMREQYALRHNEGIRIVRPVYGGASGHPVLFDAGMYAEFEAIRGDEGGKSILAKHRERTLMLPFPNAEWGYDVDTPDDLMRAERLLALRSEADR
ncbi:nucleotidyltransferase family protein [Paenibacillus glycinis]|uniref:NTP transferase domain-containing protein n=1 Tax=Paenibacillus glycinis TaxID=2697035 RepID=A0ABW9XPJ4_9BACL|nr:nucleotidyltransferase family protein [Paenibacillus glycinis]NBD24297.1 NTP transferase domain-containing protein [Paenibacillus glycinis]